jgi:hypothetical protein
LQMANLYIALRVWVLSWFLLCLFIKSNSRLSGPLVAFKLWEMLVPCGTKH